MDVTLKRIDFEKAVPVKLLVVLFENEKQKTPFKEIKKYLLDKFAFEILIVKTKVSKAKKRGSQFNAADFLQPLKELRLQKEAIFAIALTSKDLYASGLNFVFGLADSKARAAIVSTARLESKNKKVFVDRILKEIIHELGHLMLLPHCDNAECVMHFSNSLQDTDFKKKEFCSNCSARLFH